MSQTVKTDRYEVTATRVGDLWELDVAGVGVTQAERAAEAEEMVRDLIDILTDDTDADQAEIAIDWHLGDDLDAEIAEAALVRAAANDIAAAAAHAARRLTAHLKDAGLTGRDIAIVLDISEQRVSQLLKDRQRLEDVYSLSDEDLSVLALLPALLPELPSIRGIAIALPHLDLSGASERMRVLAASFEQRQREADRPLAARHLTP